jgi:hypothetical protein
MPPLALLQLDPDLTEGVYAYQLCDASRIVTVILIPEARLQRSRRMPRIDAHRWMAEAAQLQAEPRRGPARLQANPLTNEVVLGKETADHLRRCDQLGLPDNLAITGDDAERRMLQRHVQPAVEQGVSLQDLGLRVDRRLPAPSLHSSGVGPHQQEAATLAACRT